MNNKLNVDIRLENLLPKILPAGEIAGRLSEEGARFLDPSGSLSCGLPVCPPEGDADENALFERYMERYSEAIAAERVAADMLK